MGSLSPQERIPGLRDVLFGDLPLDQWPSDTAPADAEPWSSFAQAREHLDHGRAADAIREYESILAMPGLESRHYVQAWQFLRESGVPPDDAVAKTVLGVVVEVALDEGLDIVAAYADGHARYFNYSGAGVVWEAPNDSLNEPIGHLLQAGQVVASQIGPWDEPRPPAPPAGHVRLSMLTPSGLHFGQGPFETLAGDQLGGPMIFAATQLMQSLIGLTPQEQS